MKVVIKYPTDDPEEIRKIDELRAREFAKLIVNQYINNPEFAEAIKSQQVTSNEG